MKRVIVATLLLAMTLSVPVSAAETGIVIGGIAEGTGLDKQETEIIEDNSSMEQQSGNTVPGTTPEEGQQPEGDVPEETPGTTPEEGQQPEGDVPEETPGTTPEEGQQPEGDVPEETPGTTPEEGQQPEGDLPEETPGTTPEEDQQPEGDVPEETPEEIPGEDEKLDEELTDEDNLKPEIEEENNQEGLEDGGNLPLVPDEWKVSAEGDDLILESETELGIDESEEIFVRAAAGHGTIASDPSQENARVSNNTKIPLKFKLRSYGNDLDTYTIMIYKSGSKLPLAKKVGSFSPDKGYTDLIFSWDTTNVGKYPEGSYEVLCYSSYETAKGEVINEQYKYGIKLEDYKLVRTRNFVTRLYQKVMNRQPDSGGLKKWTDLLYKKQSTGAEVVKNFLTSKELTGKNLSNEEYVVVLYQAMLGREPDAAGKKIWVQALNDGMTRLGIMRDFVRTNEFTKLCNEAGIVRGTLTVTENRDQNRGATGFVSRIYSIALQRKADVKGLNYWTGVIVNKQKSPKDVARGFIFSPEFDKKKLDDTAYVKVLYKVFLNREADDSGLKFWTTELKKGKSRVKIFDGFAGSKEFKNLIASYGL